jgi:hypothetical protein
MNRLPSRLACLALLSLAALAPAHAESSASSASSAGSASVGSLSESIRGSSNSSSRTTQAAAGDYRIVAIADATDRPGALQLTLQSVERPGEDGRFDLIVPQAALAPHGAAPGEIVAVKPRPYGLEFARGATREAFFLVLADDWHGQLDSRAVPL